MGASRLKFRTIISLPAARSSPQTIVDSAATPTDAAAAAAGTPKWLTPMLLFIDLNEKVVLGMNRRAALTKVKVKIHASHTSGPKQRCHTVLVVTMI